MAARGRPKFVPTRLQRKQVAFWVSVGANLEHVAISMEVSYGTFKKAFKQEILTGKTTTMMKLSGVTMRRAMKGSERATEFLLKTQHGFKETAVHQMMDLDLSDMTEEELAVMEKALKKKMGA